MHICVRSQWWLQIAPGSLAFGVPTPDDMLAQRAGAGRVWLASSILFPRVPPVCQATRDLLRQIPFPSLSICHE
jgi:hypothetical protein